MPPDSHHKLEIDWVKTAAGAFAVVSSAFLLSTLGAAGTIIGAALGSVIVTVGGALYSQGLARSQQHLAQVQMVAMRKVGIARSEARRAVRQSGHDGAVDDQPAQAEQRIADAEGILGSVADEPSGPGWRERLVALPWTRIAVIATGSFVAAVLAITVFELAAGRSVSSITGGTEGDGGTTISRIGGGGGGSSQEDGGVPTDQQSTSDAPSDEPSGEPMTTGAPSDQSTPTPSPTPTPTPSESALPTDSPTTSPSG
jgi:hypothetical protein